MPLEIRHLPPMRLATMRHTGAYGPALAQLWDRFGHWCGQHGLSEPRRTLYGFSLDDPAATPPEQCRYDACVQIGVGLRTGTEAQVQDFAGASYAGALFRGTATEMAAAWADLMDPGQMPKGWQAVPGPAVEIYAEDFAVDPATGAFPCWLGVAVEPAR